MKLAVPKKAVCLLRTLNRNPFHSRKLFNLTHFSFSRSLNHPQSSKYHTESNNNNCLQPQAMLSKATASLVECLEEELTDHQAELERLRTQFQNLGFQLDTALSPPELKKEISADEAFYDDAVAEELAAKDEDELDEEDPEEVEREDQKETHPSDGFVVTIARRCNDGQERRLHLYCDSDKDGFQLCHIDVERPDGRKVPQDPNEVPRLRERFYGYLNDAGINDHFGGLMQRLAKATIHQQDNLTWMKEMQLFFSPTPQETPNIEDVTSSESIQEHQSTQTTQEHEQK